MSSVGKGTVVAPQKCNISGAAGQYGGLSGHLRLPEISVSVRASSKSDRPKLEIEEPFVATVARIEGALWSHIKGIGHSIEQHPSYAPSSDASSRSWYSRFFRKETRGPSDRERLDVVRLQEDGSTLRLYAVTITRDNTPGKTKVNIAPYHDAGEEGDRAAKEAVEAVRAELAADENARIKALSGIPDVALHEVNSGSPVEKEKITTGLEFALLQHESKQSRRIPVALAKGLSSEATWDEIERIEKAEKSVKDYIVCNLLDGLANNKLKHTQSLDGSISLLRVNMPFEHGGRSQRLSESAVDDELRSSLECIISNTAPDSLGELLSEIQSVGVSYTWGVKKDSKGDSCWFLDFYLPAHTTR